MASCEAEAVTLGDGGVDGGEWHRDRGLWIRRPRRASRTAVSVGVDVREGLGVERLVAERARADRGLLGVGLVIGERRDSACGTVRAR